MWSVAFAPNGKTPAIGCDDTTVKLWQVDSGKALHMFKEYTREVISVAFAPDSQTLASDSFDKIVRLWQINSGKWRYRKSRSALPC